MAVEKSIEDIVAEMNTLFKVYGLDALAVFMPHESLPFYINYNLKREVKSWSGTVRYPTIKRLRVGVKHLIELNHVPLDHGYKV